LNLLTERLDSRIDWKKSIADKVSNVEVWPASSEPTSRAEFSQFYREKKGGIC
jgi:hypothetical protein